MSVAEADHQTDAICRCCLSQDPNVKSIFAIQVLNSVPLDEQFRTCIDVDSDVTHICEECATQLKNAYSFRTRCRESDNLLNQIFIQNGESSSFMEDPLNDSHQLSYALDDQEILSTAFGSHEERPDKICRCCMATSTDMYSIFSLQHLIPLAEQLRICTELKIKESDKLPHDLCNNCMTELKNAYQFRDRCRKANKLFNDTKIIGQEQNFFVFDDQEILSTAAFECDDFKQDDSSNSNKRKYPMKLFDGNISKNLKVCKSRKSEKSNKILDENMMDLESANDSHSSTELIEKSNISTTKQKIECGVCHYQFIGMNGIKNHIRNSHKDIPESAHNSYILKGTQVEKIIEKKFSCQFCQEKFAKRAEVKRHIMRLHKNDFYEMFTVKQSGESNEIDYKCTMCQFSNNDIIQIEKHVKRMHKNMLDSTFEQMITESANQAKSLNQITCEICSRKLQFADLDDHIKEHDSKALVLIEFECEQCTFVTADEDELVNHLLEHSTEKNGSENVEELYHTIQCDNWEEFDLIQSTQCEIEVCENVEEPEEPNQITQYIDEEEFNQTQAEIEEDSSQNDPKEEFKCNICGKQYKNQSTLSSHMKNTHKAPYKGDKPHQCPICQKRYATKELLDKHETSVYVHELRKEYPCSFCAYTATRRHHLVRHMEIGTHIGREFRKRRPSKKKSLLSFTASSDDKNLMTCPLCAKRFTNSANFGKHLKMCQLILFEPVS